MSRDSYHDSGDMNNCAESLTSNGWIVIDPANESELRAGIEEAQKCLVELHNTNAPPVFECPGCHESGPNGHYDGRVRCQAIAGTETVEGLSFPSEWKAKEPHLAPTTQSSEPSPNDREWFDNAQWEESEARERRFKDDALVEQARGRNV